MQTDEDYGYDVLIKINSNIKYLEKEGLFIEDANKVVHLLKNILEIEDSVKEIQNFEIKFWYYNSVKIYSDFYNHYRLINPIEMDSTLLRNMLLDPLIKCSNGVWTELQKFKDFSSNDFDEDDEDDEE